MTNREFLNAVIGNSANSAEVIAHATAEIEKLDVRNAKRSNGNSAKAKENAPIKAAILDFLADNPNSVASEIGTAIGYSTNKASALCVQLCGEGKVISTDKKIKGKGKVKAYSLVPSDNTDGETDE